MARNRATDSQLCKALQHLGAGRVEATLLAVLLEKQKADTETLRKQTGLRQPEISVGMGLLRQRRWVKSGPRPGGSKGRPMMEYSLTAPEEAIRDHYQRRAAQAMQEYESALDVLTQSLR